MVDLWGEGDDLGNKLHSRLIYESSKEEQKRWLSKVNVLLKNFSDQNLMVFAFDKETKTLLSPL